MGEVFLARDTSLERNVAIKFLPQETRSDALARGRLLREAKSAATLDHPHICVVHEAEEPKHQKSLLTWCVSSAVAMYNGATHPRIDSPIVGSAAGFPGSGCQAICLTSLIYKTSERGQNGYLLSCHCHYESNVCGDGRPQVSCGPWKIPIPTKSFACNIPLMIRPGLRWKKVRAEMTNNSESRGSKTCARLGGYISKARSFACASCMSARNRGSSRSGASRGSASDQKRWLQNPNLMAFFSQRRA